MRFWRLGLLAALAVMASAALVGGHFRQPAWYRVVQPYIIAKRTQYHPADYDARPGHETQTPPSNETTLSVSGMSRNKLKAELEAACPSADGWHEEILSWTTQAGEVIPEAGVDFWKGNDEIVVQWSDKLGLNGDGATSVETKHPASQFQILWDHLL
jgi:hypothetical protein